jgi:lysophospholipase L1-like esterase
MTLREIVHVSLGGSPIRVVFTNEFGTEALRIDSAQVALSRGGSAVDGTPASSARLTFGGRDYAIIPAGALMVSDPVPLKLPPQSDLAITFFLPPQTITTLSQHQAADQTNYVAEGNVMESGSFEGAKEIRSWVFVKDVEVQAPAHASAVVAFGDSITDGAFASNNANARWPDELARRLEANKRTADLAVLNEGIGGNGVLRHIVGPSALSRFDRDVLGQSGVKYLVIMEAINDIGAYGPKNPNAPPPVVAPAAPPTAEDLIVGYKQLIERAHTHSIKVFMATLTPYMGAGYSSPQGEAVRTAVNQWIRTQKDADGVIDFDKITQDPSRPDTFLPAYDHGDHLHPNDTGYKAMGDAIDPALFTR